MCWFPVPPFTIVAAALASPPYTPLPKLRTVIDWLSAISAEMLYVPLETVTVEPAPAEVALATPLLMVSSGWLQSAPLLLSNPVVATKYSVAGAVPASSPATSSARSLAVWRAGSLAERRLLDAVAAILVCCCMAMLLLVVAMRSKPEPA